MTKEYSVLPRLVFSASGQRYFWTSSLYVFIKARICCSQGLRSEGMFWSDWLDSILTASLTNCIKVREGSLVWETGWLSWSTMSPLFKARLRAWDSPRLTTCWARVSFIWLRTSQVTTPMTTKISRVKTRMNFTRREKRWCLRPGWAPGGGGFFGTDWIKKGSLGRFERKSGARQAYYKQAVLACQMQRRKP